MASLIPRPYAELFNVTLGNLQTRLCTHANILCLVGDSLMEC